MFQAMMPTHQNRPVPHEQIPVRDQSLFPTEMNELFSLLQSQPNSSSSSRTSNSRFSPCSIDREIIRRQKRMLSNRESAKRSRLRKKRRVENLEDEMNRLKVQNREIKNRLCLLTHDCLLLQSDSNLLLSESIFLHQRFTGLNQMLSAAVQLRES